MSLESFLQLVVSDASDMPQEIAHDLADIRGSLLQGFGAAESIVKVATHGLGSRDSSGFPISKVKKTLVQTFNQTLDMFMATLIVFNAVVIGISTDFHPEWDGWGWLDAFFVLCFTTEMILKMSTQSCREFLYGNEWRWNLFDFVVVMVSLFDTTMFVLHASIDGHLGELVSMARLARLVRIARLVKVLKFSIFREVERMIVGMAAGLNTMFWAFVLLFLMIYTISIVLVLLIPTADRLDTYPELAVFSTVFSCMFTIFGCIIVGDCSSDSGRPLIVLLTKAFGSYGWLFGMMYCCVVLITTFGLFNLIMAIFVENTVQGVKFNEDLMKSMRERSQRRTMLKTTELVQKFMDSFKSGIAGMPEQSGLNENNLTMTREHFEIILRDEQVQSLMDDLDLAASDRVNLFDVLDADGNGKLYIKELVDGLVKLRGEARKSDVIACLLKVTAIQVANRSFQGLAMQFLHDLDARVRAMEGWRQRPAELMKLEQRPSTAGRVSRQHPSGISSMPAEFAPRV